MARPIASTSADLSELTDQALRDVFLDALKRGDETELAALRRNLHDLDRPLLEVDLLAGARLRGDAELERLVLAFAPYGETV